MNLIGAIGFVLLVIGVALGIWAAAYLEKYKKRPKAWAWLTNFWDWIDSIRNVPIPAVVSGRVLQSYVSFNRWFAYVFLATNIYGLLMFPQIVAALPEIELAGGLAQRVETIGWSLKVIAALQLIFFLGGYIFVRALQPYGGDFKALPTNRQGFYGLLALLVLVASVIGTFWTLWVSIRTLFPYFIAVFPAIFEDSFRSSLRAQITIVPLI